MRLCNCAKARHEDCRKIGCDAAIARARQELVRDNVSLRNENERLRKALEEMALINTTQDRLDLLERVWESRPLTLTFPRHHRSRRSSGTR
jgi:regulator of replication initiation timing